MSEPSATSDPLSRHRVERKRLSENHYNRGHAIGAWLLATLVTVNVAGLAAALSHADEASTDSLDSAALFIAGVVTAILSGFVGQEEAQQRSLQYFAESLTPEQYLLGSGDIARAGKAEKLASRLTWAARLLNYGSLGCFTAGAIWTLVAL